jgi:adenosylhomocysteine nucleosidase
VELSRGVILFALAREAGPLVKRLKARGIGVLKQSDSRGFPAWRAGGLMFGVAGMGLANAGAAAAALLAGGRPGWVVTTGFAGALKPGVAAGEVFFDADGDFPAAARLAPAGAKQGRFVSEPRVAVLAAEKAALRARTGADAVDMESAVIRDACRAAGVPSATVRVISDAADEDLPLDFNRLTRADGNLSSVRLALAIAARPGLIPRLIRFGGVTAKAGERLAEVLDDALVGAGV